ncbi:MAG: type II secretion system protein N [Rhodanobacter sp.]
MKAWQKVGLVLAVLVFCAAAVVWVLPARWALSWLAPQLHGLQLQQVQGTLWNGRAAHVLAPTGRDLGAAQWQLSRRALLGQVDLHLLLDGPQLNFSGTLRNLPADQVEWRDVTLRLDLALLPTAVPAAIGQPGGELTMQLDHALLQSGWPLQLSARGQWRSASLHTRRAEFVLGTMQWQAAAQNGAIQAQLRDDGHGPLEVAMSAQLSPLGWRLDARLHAQQTASMALRQWLASLGPVDSSGTVTLHRDGGLARLLPAAPSPLAWK